MIKKLSALLAIPVLAIAVTGCTVEQEREGELPEVSVEGGQLPKYDVDMAEVEIKGEERTISVPTDIDIKTEERTITVPTVEINPPEDTIE